MKQYSEGKLPGFLSDMFSLQIAVPKINHLEIHLFSTCYIKGCQEMQLLPRDAGLGLSSVPPFLPVDPQALTDCESWPQTMLRGH